MAEYASTMLVLPQDATPEQLAWLLETGYPDRRTFGFSYDDAAELARNGGDAVLYDIPAARQQDFRDWYAARAPDANVVFAYTPDYLDLSVWEPYYLWMRDPLWRDEPLDGTSCGYTIGEMGCYTTNLAMAQRIYGIKASATPLTVNEDLGEDGFSGCNALYSAAERELGIRISREGDLNAHLDAGGIAMAEVYPPAYQHFVLLVARHGDDYIAMDPWDNQDSIGLFSEMWPGGMDSFRLLYKVEAPAPKKVRGVHAAPIPSPPQDQQFWLDELKAMGITYYKTLATGGSDMLAWLELLLQNGIEPIVRLYQGGQFPFRLNGPLIDYADELIAAGITYFEIGNEPNLECEWHELWRDKVDWHNTDLVEQVAETWYQDAVEIMAAGGKPAFYAMAPTDRGGVNQKYSGPMWATTMVEYLARRHPSLGGALQDGTVWVATHTSPFNRPLDYDPLTAGNFDDMCMRGHEYYSKLFKAWFGVTPTIISTEGGAYSPEHLEFLGWGTYTEEHWAQLVLDVFAYTQDSELKAMCPWILTDEDVHDPRWHDNGWYHGRSPRLPVQALKGD